MTKPETVRTSAEDFTLATLRNEPTLDFATLRERARAAGITLQPIHFGRARKHLGLPPVSAPLPALRPAAAGKPVEPRGEAPAGDRAETGSRDVGGRDVGGRDAARGDAGGGAPDAAPAPDVVPPRKQGSPAFEFVLAEMRRNPEIVYADLRDRAKLHGFSIAPIVYGRAKAVLGLVPVKPRASKRAAAAAAAAPRRLRQVESVAADHFAQKLDDIKKLEQLVGTIKELDAERRRLRAALERVGALIEEALG